MIRLLLGSLMTDKKVNQNTSLTVVVGYVKGGIVGTTIT